MTDNRIAWLRHSLSHEWTVRPRRPVASVSRRTLSRRIGVASDDRWPRTKPPISIRSKRRGFVSCGSAAELRPTREAALAGFKESSRAGGRSGPDRVARRRAPGQSGARPARGRSPAVFMGPRCGPTTPGPRPVSIHSWQSWRKLELARHTRVHRGGTGGGPSTLAAWMTETERRCPRSSRRYPGRRCCCTSCSRRWARALDLYGDGEPCPRASERAPRRCGPGGWPWR